MGVDVLQTLWFFLPAYVGNMVPVLMGDSFESLARPIDGGRSLDSMDVLNLMIGLHEKLGVEIPESDYAKLATLDGCVGYLARALT